MIGCLTETTTCVVAQPLVILKELWLKTSFPLLKYFAYISFKLKVVEHQKKVGPRPTATNLAPAPHRTDSRTISQTSVTLTVTVLKVIHL